MEKTPVVVAGALVAGFLGGAIAGSLRSAPDTVTAKGFQVLDDVGNPRAELVLGPDGEPALILRDAKGDVRAALAISKDGMVALALTDNHKNTRAWFRVGADETPVLHLVGRDGTSLVELSAEDGFPPQIRLLGKGKKVVWSAP